MKNISLYRSIGICLMTFLFIQCKSESQKTTAQPKEEEKELAFFTPQPKEVSEQPIKTLEIGMAAPNFKLPGTDGTFHNLSDYADAKALVIIFTCNHCPTAQAYEERIKDIVTDYKDKSVQVLAISPNSPLGLLYEELGYSDLGDSFEDMIIRAEEHNFNFPYLYDGDDQKVTLAYGPIATPHTFVFDQKRILQYVGRIDNSEEPGTANGEDVRQAIDAIITNTPMAVPETKTFGCSTKWGWKTKTRTKVDKEWTEKLVGLEEINVDEIKKLMKNDSEKLRLINVWATWCGPCRIEYPDFIVIQRMFGDRDFEFISVSADKLDKKEAALKFLEQKYSAVPNYISTAKNNYDLVDAIDPEWKGALPYTVLIEPGGKVVWSHQGEVNFQALKRTIVDHKMIGRVY